MACYNMMIPYPCPELPPVQQKATPFWCINRWPHVVGRARCGRITIANSDSGGGAYTDSAINQGHRAVMELLHTAKA
jgi:hypothetical protein